MVARLEYRSGSNGRAAAHLPAQLPLLLSATLQEAHRVRNQAFTNLVLCVLRSHLTSGDSKFEGSPEALSLTPGGSWIPCQTPPMRVRVMTAQPHVNRTSHIC